MKQGKIVETGTHEELLKNIGHYATLVAMDLENNKSENTGVILSKENVVTQ